MDTPKPPAPAARSWLDMPEVPRALPFVLFLLVGSLAGKSFPGSEYWLYAAKTVAVGALLWVWRRRIPEMRWAFSPEAVVVGIAIAVLWLGLDGRIPTLGELWDLGRKLVTGKAPDAAKAADVWNPLAFFKDQPALGWAMLAVRVAGRSLVVPAMEEVFYRSFFHRTLVGSRLDEIPLGVRNPRAFWITSAVFGACHPDHWLPGVLCGAAYQWLVVRRGRLGDAMLAHAVTNLAISGYAIATGRWEFS